MKNIILPKGDNINSIDLLAIDDNIQGVIIGYKKDKPAGYIIYNETTWEFNTIINAWYSDVSNDDLYSLMKELIVTNLCDSFKLIDFTDDNEK